MAISRRKFLTTTALGSAAIALRSQASADPSPPTVATQSKTARRSLSQRPQRPNLLFLWSDQHRADVLPSAGNTVIQAPNLGALAERSFVFNQAYCAQPVCTASRGCIMTGLYPHNHGSVDLNTPLAKNLKTIAEYVNPDYATGYFGKWHLGDEISPQHGFRDWVSIEDLYWQFYSDPETKKKRSNYHHFLWENGFPPDLSIADLYRQFYTGQEMDKNMAGNALGVFSRNYTAAMSQQYTKCSFLAKEAERFLRERRDGQPFLLSVCNLEPHDPRFGPFNDRYDLASLPTGPAWNCPVSPNASKLHRDQAAWFARHGTDGGHSVSNEWDLRRLRANYYGLVSMVDEGVGRILRALEDSGQAENTIVVYTSDHGDMLGDHRLMDKCLFYEQATRVPLIIHVPWLSNQQIRLNGPISQVDLMPTLLDLLGCEVPAGLDGRSRAGELARPASWQPGSIFIEWHDYNWPLGEKWARPPDRACDGRSITTADQWKLNLFRGDDPELYDLNSDPAELHNLGRDPAQRDRIRHLSGEIRAWQERHRDTMPLVYG